MKRKPVPAPPASRDRLDEVRRALPLVPGSEDDCCARLQSRADVPDRSAAGEWLEFLCALGLARETQSGFVRTREDLDADELAQNFRSGVVLADEALALLADADEPEPVDAVFDAVRSSVPRWEQRKRDNWQAVWRDRTGRLLDWAVLLGLATETDGGYTTP